MPTQPTQATSAHILVAEDDPLTAQYVTDLLGTLGYRVTVASDGTQALDKAQRELPDLILLDIRLPSVTGFDVCRTLKSWPATQHIPVIMLTALEASEAKVYSLQIGADDYITKPFSHQELAARIRTRLRAKEREDELRRRATQIRQTFQRYVAPAVVERLLANPEQVVLGGQVQQVTVLFADLRGFTSLAAQRAAQEMVAILNHHLTAAAQSVIDQEGTLDKFMGDGVMALFNAPLAQEDHVLRAARAALALRDSTTSAGAPLPGLPLQFGIGICTGQALVGNIGTPQLMNYTAIGMPVNQAKRLQEVAKAGQVLLCPRTQAILGDAAETRHLQVSIRLGDPGYQDAHELLRLRR